MAEIVQPVVRPVVGAVCVGGSQEGGGGPPALTVISAPSLPVNTFISTSNTVTPAVWSQTITNRRFDYFKGSLPAYPSTVGRYRAGNTSLTHTPQPAPHPDNVSVGDTIFVREMVDYGGVTYYADSVGRVVQTATPTLTGIFQQIYPSDDFAALGNYPEVICANSATGANSQVAISTTPADGIYWTDGQPRFRKTTSDDGYPVIELCHEQTDPLHVSAQRCEMHFWPPNGGVTFPFNDAAPIEFWQSKCFRLPDRSASDPNKLIAQWHQGGGTVNPFFSLSQAGSNLLVEIRYNANTNPQQAQNVVFTNSSTALPAPGSWITIVIRAKLGYTTTGSPLIQIWMNGTLIIDRTGTNGRCGYNSTQQRFFRDGFYPWNNMLSGSRRTQWMRGLVSATGAYDEPFMRSAAEVDT